MTKSLLELSVASLTSDSCLQFCRLNRIVAAGCIAAFLVGCGGDAATNSTTSNEDIAAFIEDNPEYGDSTAAPGKLSNSSEPPALGLER